jgi:hypothetical protein
MDWSVGASKVGDRAAYPACPIINAGQGLAQCMWCLPSLVVEEAILSSPELVSGRYIHLCWLWDHRLSSGCGRALVRTSSVDMGHRALCSEPQLCLTLVSALLSHVVVHVVHNAPAAHNGRFAAPVNWVPR